MTVKELREQLANLPDDAVVILNSEDDYYRASRVEAGTAKLWDDRFGRYADFTPADLQPSRRFTERTEQAQAAVYIL